MRKGSDQILKAQTEQSGFTGGVLEVLPDGFASSAPDYNYLPGPDDICSRRRRSASSISRPATRRARYGRRRKGATSR
jgi:transcription termination factor Rho